jgi:ribosomal protein L11 methyltransferase
MNFNSKKYTIDVDPVRETALGIVASAPAKITSLALEKKIVEQFKLNKKQIKSIIRNLVSDGELAYIYQYGSTYLELSFNRPRRVSQFVVLNPPGHSYRLGPGEVAVQIQPGASFGDGRHPTTRLAIRGIEMVLRQCGIGRHFSGAGVLDVGCGSGVLVIAAICLGAASGLGIDFDACALAESRYNVQLNALENRIEISGQPLESIRGRFLMVTANLRYPSLKQLRSQLSSLTAAGGVLVISGIRDIELQDLLQDYAEKQWVCRWRQTEAGWAGAVLQRAQ